jgi:hypothetical protein
MVNVDILFACIMDALCLPCKQKFIRAATADYIVRSIRPLP